MKPKKSRFSARILTIILSIMLIFGLVPVTAMADSPPPSIILITSDVHDKTTELQNWVTAVHESTPTLNHMIFGGDYTYTSDPAGVSSTCASIVNSIYPGVPIVKGKGNHDSSGTFSTGLVANENDYAIYALDLDTSQTISMDKIEALDTALSGIDASKPVIVVSHYPLHYCNNNGMARTTANASELVKRLNKYPNAIFLWGHNHTLSDPGYGTVKKAGDTIQCASGSSPVKINFTYANMGSIYSSVNNAAGVLLTMTKSDGNTVLGFQYKNAAGANSSAFNVTIDTTLIAEKPTINAQPQSVSVDIGNETSLSVDAVVSDGGTLSYQWFEDDSDDCSGGTEVGENSAVLPVPTQTPGTKYYYCRITNTKDGDTASVTSAAAHVRVQSGEAGGITYDYAASIQSGGRYVIVDKSDTDAFALTTESATVGSTAYLACHPVTVSGSTLDADDIDASMIWEMTADGSGFNVKNASSLLHRKSGTSGIYLNTSDEGASYTDWTYNGTTHNLSVYSSGQRKDFYLYQASSGGINYFANSETPGNSIYLYQVNVSNPIDVNNVAITGVDEPVPGAAPDTSAATASTGVVSPAAVSWTPAANPFGYDTAYTASITLSAQFGYEFTSGTAVTINGTPANTVVLNSNGTLTATCAFDKTAAAPLVSYDYVTSIESGSTYVIVDKGTPNYALVASVANSNYLAAAEVTVNGSQLNPQGITSNMLWTFTSDGNSSFNVINGSKYLTRPSGGDGKITLETSDGDAANTDWQYNSTNNVLKMKGTQSTYYLYQTGSGTPYFAATSTESNAKNIYLYKRTETPTTFISDAKVTGIDVPVAGNAPDTTASVSTAGVTASAVTWTPSTAAFSNNTVYTASVRLYPQSGYAFADGAKVTINGQTANVARNTNGSLTASYAFGPTENEKINSVEVTDVVAPVAGAIPNLSASTSTPNVTVLDVLWNPSNNPFDYGTVYTAIVQVSPQPGYAFADTVTATINGFSEPAVRNADGTLTISHTFDATKLGIISGVEVTDIDAPVAGAAPDLSASVLTPGVVASAVTWMPEDNPFEDDKDYTASVTLTAPIGYVFAGGTAVTINGETADVSPGTDGKLIASYTFTGTADVPITDISVTDITAPAAGAVPDTTAATSIGGVDVSAVSWEPDVTEFGYHTAYTASVTLTAQDGYVFSGGAAVTINGETADVSPGTDGKLIASYTFVDTADEPISSIEITDIDAPTANAAPDTTAATSTGGVDLSAVSWTPDDNPFDFNTVYTASVTLTAQDGYVFAGDTRVTVNGEAATVSSGTDSTLIASYTFAKTADEPITDISVTGIDAPAANAAPDTTAVVSTGVDVSAVTWTPDVTAFGYHTAYTASVTLTAQDGYVFASGAAVTINGETATVEPGTDGTLIASYGFAKTADEPITDISVTGIDAPAANAAPDTTAVVSTGVDVSAVTWEPDDNPFDFDTVYTASVTLTAQDGYVFASGAAVTINGETATVAPGSGGTLIATYTFAETEATADAETPNITGQPQNVTVSEGGQADLSVTATVSKGTLSYQWYKNAADDTASGTLITGANAESYSAPTDTIGTLYYYCAVTNTDPDATGAQKAEVKTQTCKVIVQTPQYVITALPSNSSYGTATGGGRYDKGASVTLTAAAKQGYCFVCWKKNGTEVSRSLVYTFTVLGSASYTAQFAAATPLTISCSKTDASIYGTSTGTVTVTASGGDSGSYDYSINGGTNWQSSGSFSGLAAGTYTAAVRDAVNTDNTATCSVMVGQPSHLGSFPAKKLPSKVNAGTALTIIPPAAPKGYTVVSVTYSSGSPSVASVDSAGNVTFLTGGKTTIITKMVTQTTDKKGKIKTKTTTIRRSITVKQLVSSMTLNTTSATIARTQKLKLAASIAPVTASNKKVSWKSSNPKVASVSSSGVVTGKAGGTAIITCTAKDGSGVTVSCTVTVTPIYPSGVKISKASLTVKTGKTATLKASVKPSNTDFKTVTWASSNTAVATVDAKGRVKAISPGTAVISATTSSGQTAACTVTVK